MEDPEWNATKAVAAVNRRFYQAFEQADFEAMKAVWLDHPEARCVHPGGEMIVGTGRVLASWAAIFRGGVQRSFDLLDLSVSVRGSVAWVCGIEQLCEVGPEGERYFTAAVTNLFSLEGDSWRMYLHHASPVFRRIFPEAT